MGSPQASTYAPHAPHPYMQKTRTLDFCLVLEGEITLVLGPPDAALTERRRKPLRRSTLRRLFEIYAERFADPDGRVRATFEVVWLSGWAPHESQQQPLKPGSAKTRLADALRTSEISTGEKAGN